MPDWTCPTCHRAFSFGTPIRGVAFGGMCGACYQRKRRASKWRAPVDRTCQHCGVTFTPSRSDARYCSHKCRQHAHRTRITAPAMPL